MVSKRKNEKFKRIKRSTLAKYLAEQVNEESIYNLNKDDGAFSVRINFNKFKFYFRWASKILSVREGKEMEILNLFIRCRLE